MQRRFNATLAALLFTAAAPALAQQSAEVSAGHLAYRLVDLAPDDGIAPLLSWTSDSFLAYASVYDRQTQLIDGVQIETAGSSGFTNDYASARVDAQGDAAHIRFDLASGYGYASSNRGMHFTLSPHTRVVFDLDADLWASADPAAGSLPTAMAELYGSLHGMGDGDWTFSTRAQVDGGSQHGTLSVSALSQDAWVDGYLAYSAYAVAESQALPVPEPAPGAMLAGGLALLALRARRRHRQGR
jgi:hypothetical protein